MNQLGAILGLGLLASVAFGSYGCCSLQSRTTLPNPIVGAWLVKDPNAPFPCHMYVFNRDERLLLGGSLHMHVPWIRAPKQREERPGGLADAAYLLFA
jgi:hypothetical protein